MAVAVAEDEDDAVEITDGVFDAEDEDDAVEISDGVFDAELLAVGTMGELEPIGQSVPIGQTIGVRELKGQYEPSGQMVQDVAPLVPPYVPAAQEIHVEIDLAPMATLYFPATHEVQDDGPVTGLG